MTAPPSGMDEFCYCWNWLSRDFGPFFSCLACLLAVGCLPPRMALSRCWHHALGLLSLQNYEPNKFLFFISYPDSSVVIAEENGLRQLCSGQVRNHPLSEPLNLSFSLSNPVVWVTTGVTGAQTSEGEMVPF